MKRQRLVSKQNNTDIDEQKQIRNYWEEAVAKWGPLKPGYVYPIQYMGQYAIVDSHPWPCDSGSDSSDEGTVDFIYLHTVLSDLGVGAAPQALASPPSP